MKAFGWRRIGCWERTKDVCARRLMGEWASIGRVGGCVVCSNGVVRVIGKGCNVMEGGYRCWCRIGGGMGLMGYGMGWDMCKMWDMGGMHVVWCGWDCIGGLQGVGIRV